MNKEDDQKKRILLYSHDTVGLGNISRTLKISRQLALDLPDVAQLIITGSVYPPCFNLPNQADYIKLPSVTRLKAGYFQSAILPMDYNHIKALREKIIFNTVKNFEPDLVLVDRNPGGIGEEMTRSLQYLKLKKSQTKLILGMRDIDDEPQVVRKYWQNSHAYELLHNVYDLILLYGSKKIFNPIKEYRLSSKIEDKVIECGYQGKFIQISKSTKDIHKELKLKYKKLITVTVGGGEDGSHVIEDYLKMLVLYQQKKLLDFDSLIITGPKMPLSKQLQFQKYLTLGLPLTIKNFIPDLYNYLFASDLIVSMGGYNTVSEILCLKKKAIIIPRSTPKIEQLIRAQRLRRQKLVWMIHPDKLSSASLFKAIKKGLKNDLLYFDQVGINMDGIKKTSKIIAALLKLPITKKEEQINKLSCSRFTNI